MGIVVVVLGVLQILAGLAAYGAAISAIHQILGALFLGMGILSVALGFALQELTAIRLATERHADAMEVLRKRQVSI
jgi:hypothetical protein